MKNKTKLRISLSLVAVFFLVLVVGRLTGDPDVDVFYVEKTMVSASYNTSPSMITDYYAALLSHEGNYYKCNYSSNTYTALNDEEVDDALENLLGDQIGYVYGNHNVYWATFQDELDTVTDIGLIYEVKGYDVSEAVAVLFNNYSSNRYAVLDEGIDIFEMSDVISIEANGRNLYLFEAYDDTDTDEEEI